MRLRSRCCVTSLGESFWIGGFLAARNWQGFEVLLLQALQVSLSEVASAEVLDGRPDVKAVGFPAAKFSSRKDLPAAQLSAAAAAQFFFLAAPSSFVSRSFNGLDSVHPLKVSSNQIVCAGEATPRTACFRAYIKMLRPSCE